MKICHTQPHLVPPMKLVFYDDLPSPGLAPQSSNLSHWVAEGRNLASRASNRASINTLWRRPSRKPTISQPSDFRRVNPPPARLDNFRPLELSIYRPGSQLPELPTFGDFDLEGLEEPKEPKPPPRARSPGARHRSQSSFQLPRKPVGSSPRPSSAFVGTTGFKGHTMPQRQRPTADSYMSPASNHRRTQSEANPPIRRVRSKSEPFLSLPNTQPNGRSQSMHHTSVPQDSIQKETLATEERQSDSSTPPQTPAARNSFLSYRVARWLFPSSPPSPNRTSDQTLSSRLSQFWASPNGQPAVLHKRNRTLSGSTITPSIMATNNGGHRTNPSISSGATAATLHQHPSFEIILDKEIESGNYPPPPNSGGKANIPPSLFQEACPTVYEGEQQLGHDFRPQHRQSAVGLAF